MNTFKATLAKLSIILFTLIFAAGCGTVTDANLDSELPDEPTVTTSTVDGDDWLSGAGDGMEPIIERRDTDEDER